ncbi:MAG: hypothetical protein EXR36_02760 [Betaproteobacteria bacterium]|nr:hypothetical protein [Betaproteobacteria bacterium]
MNAKLITLAIASLVSSSVFAAECPGRAGVCHTYTATPSRPASYVGTPVSEVSGRAGAAIAKVSSPKAKEPVVSYERLYRPGRA